MENYGNLSSGISAYEIGPDSITVRFKDGWSYLFTYASAGKGNVEQMKALAKAGSGLNTFITKNVRHLYASKF